MATPPPYRRPDGSPISPFTPKKGPVFANLLLADEINRAPAKVQSALLEAMQERRVTLGDETYDLPDVLRHRVLVTYEAEAEEITSEAVVARILREIPVP